MRIFEKKAQNEYETQGRQLELLIYYDRQTRPPDGALLENTQRRLNLLAQAMLLEEWSRLWIYDAAERRILWVVDQSRL